MTVEEGYRQIAAGRMTTPTTRMLTETYFFVKPRHAAAPRRADARPAGILAVARALW